MEQHNEIVVECPNCFTPVLIEKLNCCIFRHGVLKANGQQINPHALKELCDFYVEKDLIVGCGKPFQIIVNPVSKDKDDKFIAIKCDYI